MWKTAFINLISIPVLEADRESIFLRLSCLIKPVSSCASFILLSCREALGCDSYHTVYFLQDINKQYQNQHLRQITTFLICMYIVVKGVLKPVVDSTAAPENDIVSVSYPSMIYLSIQPLWWLWFTLWNHIKSDAEQPVGPICVLLVLIHLVMTFKFKYWAL